MLVKSLVWTAFLTVLCILGSCTSDRTEPAMASVSYDVVPIAQRQFEWDTKTGPGWIKVLVEEATLGSTGVEMAEIYFPPGFKGTTHPHELEIIYVLEGELDHIVNGESHILKPGMVGVVREPDLVVHRTNSTEGVRTLVIWPLGKEVSGFGPSGMREVSLLSRSD
jgi:quercetin dioxygenase-like cupin family protein